VDHPDPGTADLDNALDRQEQAECRLVDIPEDAENGRTEPAELVQERPGHEVARVQDRVGRPQSLDARVRKPA